MAMYEIDFGKLGDTHPVPPLTITASDTDDLCRKVTEHAAPHLGPALTAMGHPEYADCAFQLRTPALGEFVWHDPTSGDSVRFCRATLTEIVNVTGDLAQLLAAVAEQLPQDDPEKCARTLAEMNRRATPAAE